MEQDAKKYLEKLRDKDLRIICEEMQQPTYPDDSLVRKVIQDVYGKQEPIFVLQLQNLMWPLLQVTMERMIAYSPCVEK